MPSRLILRLLVVFTRQLEILVTTLHFCLAFTELHLRQLIVECSHSKIPPYVQCSCCVY